MKKTLLTIKLIFFVIILSGISFVSTYAADDDGWTLIPEGSTSAAEAVSKAKPGEVWKDYNDNAKHVTAGDSFASGVFSWNSVFEFFQKLAKTLSGIGLVIGAAMIVYAGYKYATGVFTGDAAKGGQDAVKGAIYGVLIVIFSYAIMKLLISTFL